MPTQGFGGERSTTPFLSQGRAKVGSFKVKLPRLDYKTCKDCGRPSVEVGTLSHTRLCVSCWERRKLENNMGISTKTGPAFRYWRRQMAASVGAVLLDDVRDAT